MALGVVIEQVGEHLVAVVDQMHVAGEFSLLGIEFVSAVLGTEFGVVAVIDNRSAVKVVAHIGVDLIVQGIGDERGAAVLETHVASQLCHTLLAVVVKHVTIDPQRVALCHAHVTEGIQRTGLGIEVGTVTEHVHVTTAETHIAFQHLVVTAHHLIGLQQVGILKEDLVGLIAVGLGNLGGDAVHFRTLSPLLRGLCRLGIGRALDVFFLCCDRTGLGALRGLRPHDRRHQHREQTKHHDDMAPAGVTIACGAIARVPLVMGCGHRSGGIDYGLFWFLSQSYLNSQLRQPSSI